LPTPVTIKLSGEGQAGDFVATHMKYAKLPGLRVSLGNRNCLLGWLLDIEMARKGCFFAHVNRRAIEPQESQKHSPGIFDTGHDVHYCFMFTLNNYFMFTFNW
jgi:hypothetical protein